MSWVWPSNIQGLLAELARVQRGAPGFDGDGARTPMTQGDSPDKLDAFNMRDAVDGKLDLPSADSTISPEMGVATVRTPACSEIGARDRDRNATYLMAAAYWGRKGNVAALVDAGAEIDAVDNEGRSALLYAVEAGQLDTAEVLLKAGAGMSSEGSHTRREETPLTLATKLSDLPMVELLLQYGADPDTRNAAGRSALAIAAAEGNLALAECLVQHGADVAGDQATSFLAAIQTGHLNIARFLEEHQPLDTIVRALRSPTMCTVIINACTDARMDIVRYLASMGIDVNITDEGGYPLLTKIISFCHPVFARYLMKQGADPNPVASPPPLRVAIVERRKDMVECLLAAGANMLHT